MSWSVEPSRVRSEKLQDNNSSAGDDVALQDRVFMPKAMARGVLEARPALGAQVRFYVLQEHDANAASKQ